MMKTIQTTLILTSLCLTATSFAAQPKDTDAAKQAARDTCLTKAMENYGSATIKSTSNRKKKIGKLRGYPISLKVGSRNKSVKCLADANGETIFYDAGR
jgi:hypothetical protein